MKKIYATLLLWGLLCAANAQSFTPPSYAEVPTAKRHAWDNNYRTYVNNVFGALEANRVATGLLVDYGFDFADPKIYNGSVLTDSTLVEPGIYSNLYKTLFSSKFNNNAGTLRHPAPVRVPTYRKAMGCYPAPKNNHFIIYNFL
jgi:hypothetical protein